MGLLDSVIGSMLGQVLGGNAKQGEPQGGGASGTLSSPIVQALIALVLSKAGGGLGDILGGDRREPHSTGSEPYDPDARGGRSPYGRDPAPDEGDFGGFGGAPSRGDDDFSDLSGMLDGPGERAPQSPGQGPYAHLDREPGEGGDHRGGGLDGLIESFQRGGLGDVIGSWIGQGGNQPIAPNRLADALGSDTLDTLSRRTGLGRDDLLQQLAQALPAVIDRLTPQGRPPSRDEMRNWL